MKLLNSLKLTLAGFAAAGLISSAEAASFSVTAGSQPTINIAIPPNVTSGTAFTGAGNTGTRFDFNLGATIDTAPGQTAMDLVGSIVANGAGTIEVCLTAEGFSPIIPVVFGFVANSTGNANPITLSDALLINGMSQQASTNGVTLAAALHRISQGQSNTVSITPNSSPFSLENCVTITFGAGGGMVSFDKITGGGGVPDNGMTLSMLGLGLLALAGIAKLRIAAIG